MLNVTLPGTLLSFIGAEAVIVLLSSIILSILLSAFGTVFGMFALNLMPRPYHPLDKVPAFKRVTDDKFFLSIEVSDPLFDMEATQKLLDELGGTGITVVEE